MQTLFIPGNHRGFISGAVKKLSSGGLSS